MEKNILIVHGGGPTAVINSPLYGVLKEAKSNSEVSRIYAARNGNMDTCGKLYKSTAAQVRL